MRRWTCFPALLTLLFLGCGAAIAPTPTTDDQPATDSPTPEKSDSTPAPGTDPDAASKVPIRPIPE
jgi:hypothetical protein